MRVYCPPSPEWIPPEIGIPPSKSPPETSWHFITSFPILSYPLIPLFFPLLTQALPHTFFPGHEAKLTLAP